jgi:hypothetical protein
VNERRTRDDREVGREVLKDTHAVPCAVRAHLIVVPDECERWDAPAVQHVCDLVQRVHGDRRPRVPEVALSGTHAALWRWKAGRRCGCGRQAPWRETEGGRQRAGRHVDGEHVATEYSNDADLTTHRHGRGKVAGRGAVGRQGQDQGQRVQ